MTHPSPHTLAYSMHPGQISHSLVKVCTPHPAPHPFSCPIYHAQIPQALPCTKPRTHIVQLQLHCPRPMCPDQDPDGHCNSLHPVQGPRTLPNPSCPKQSHVLCPNPHTFTKVHTSCLVPHALSKPIHLTQFHVHCPAPYDLRPIHIAQCSHVLPKAYATHPVLSKLSKSHTFHLGPYAPFCMVRL